MFFLYEKNPFKNIITKNLRLHEYFNTGYAAGSTPSFFGSLKKRQAGGSVSDKNVKLKHPIAHTLVIIYKYWPTILTILKFEYVM